MLMINLNNLKKLNDLTKVLYNFFISSRCGVVTVRLVKKDRDITKIAEHSHEVFARVDESRQEAKMA